MKYRGNFRRPLVKNGSTQPHTIERAAERDYRQYNATADDVIAMVNGAGFTVKYGKQTIGYYATERQASFEAGRLGAVAYKLVRAGDPNKSTHVILVPVEDEEYNNPTAAELIADKIRDQISADDAPLSPLAKQRVVLMLFSYCRDKQIAWECFQILYPIALKEQFERLWGNVSESDSPISEKDAFNQYAQARSLQEVAEAILAKDVKACIAACASLNVSSSQFEELYQKALQNNFGVSDNFHETVAKHIARSSVERRIDGDILRMLKSAPMLKVMASTGNDDGIIEYLQSNGYQKREAEEICSEIISIGKLINNI